MSFDAQRLSDLALYLKQRRETGQAEVQELRSLTGGVSSTVIWVSLSDGRQWVVKQALPKLRVQTEWRADPGRARVEAMALRWFKEWLAPGATPEFVFADEANHLLCMHAVSAPARTFKAALMQGQVEPAAFAQLGEMLGVLHLASHRKLAEITPLLRHCNYIEALRIEPYYLFTAAQLPQASPLLNAMAESMRTRRDGLVHGDFSPKNILVAKDRLVLVDHEVAHIGDRAFDVGFFMTHIIAKSIHFPEYRAPLLAGLAAFWQSYARTISPLIASDPDVEARSCAHLVSCLLARCLGRSPLEYLDPRSRGRVLERALGMAESPPGTVMQAAARA